MHISASDSRLQFEEGICRKGKFIVKFVKSGFQNVRALGSKIVYMERERLIYLLNVLFLLLEKPIELHILTT